MRYLGEPKDEKQSFSEILASSNGMKFLVQPFQLLNQKKDISRQPCKLSEFEGSLTKITPAKTNGWHLKKGIPPWIPEIPKLKTIIF